MEDYKNKKRKNVIKRGWYVTMEQSKNVKTNEPANWSYSDYAKQYKEMLNRRNSDDTK